MVVIHRVKPVGRLGMKSPGDGSILAFLAEQDETVVGLTFAESHPKVLHVLNLEGETDVCRLLLDRLVRAAGERNLSGVFPITRPDILELVEEWGFTRGTEDGRPSVFSCWDRNEEGAAT
jgi:hypothetical protein